MRITITLLTLVFPLLLFGQDYKLFNSQSIKTYLSSPVADTTYSIQFDTVLSSGSDSVYYNHQKVSDLYINSMNCSFWGGQMSNPQDVPSWLGEKVIYNINDKSYNFLTNSGDTIKLNFPVIVGDSSLFYHDVTQKFYLKYEGIDTILFSGIIDSARYYRIMHYDALGQSINSPLNNELIIVGKTFGMMQFFRIDKFPDILQRVDLIGNNSPLAGMTYIDHGMLMDHQPGDEIQYHDFFKGYSAPIWDKNEYIKYHFLTRTDTQDSVIYLTERFTFSILTGNQALDTIALAYKKSTIFALAPFDIIDQSITLRTKNLGKKGYNTLSLWTWEEKYEYLIYCAPYNCWGTYDIPGPPENQLTQYVSGIGLFHDSKYTISPQGFTSTYEVVYFKKDGIIWGNQAIVGLKTPNDHSLNFNAWPNPAGAYLIVESGSLSNGLLSLKNTYGQEIMRLDIEDKITHINIESLPSGMYILEMTDGTSRGVKKIIKN